MRKINLLIVAAILILAGCSKEKENNVYGELPTESETVSESYDSIYDVIGENVDEVETLPDREVSEPAPGYMDHKNAGIGLVLEYPDEYISESDENFLKLDDEKRTIIVYYSPTPCAEPLQLVSQISKAKDINFSYNGEEYRNVLLDTYSREPVDGLNAYKEYPVMEFCNTKFEFIKPACVTLYAVVDGKGVIVIGLSMDEEIEKLESEVIDIVKSFKPYEPVKDDFLSQEYKDYDDAETNISFSYPGDWVLTDKNGKVLIEPLSSSNLAGAKIIYFSDASNQYVEDYAGYAQDIKYIIANTYVKRDKPFNEEELEINTVVESTQFIKIAGSDAICFEISEEYLPKTYEGDRYLTSGGTIKSIRYCFDSNNIPVMISIQFPEGLRVPLQDIIDKVVESIELR